MLAELLLVVATASHSGRIDMDLAWVLTAQERVTWQVRDADARFLGSRTYRGTGFPVVCGEVAPASSRTYQRFIVVGESILLETRVGAQAFQFTWLEFCR